MWVKLEDWAKENISWSMSRSQLRRLASTGRLHPATKIAGRWCCKHDAELIPMDTDVDTSGMSERARSVIERGGL